jgi:hypothetical protein
MDIFVNFFGFLLVFWNKMFPVSPSSSSLFEIWLVMFVKMFLFLFLNKGFCRFNFFIYISSSNGSIISTVSIFHAKCSIEDSSIKLVIFKIILMFEISPSIDPLKSLIIFSACLLIGWSCFCRCRVFFYLELK